MIWRYSLLLPSDFLAVGLKKCGLKNERGLGKGWVKVGWF